MNIIAAILKMKWLLVAAVVLAILRCIWLWQPERQVELHQRHFLEAAQDRKWAKFDAFFDNDFRAPNGQGKTWTLQQAHEVLRQFFALEIHASQTETRLEGTTGHVRSLLRIEGTGMGLGEMAKTAVNESNDPFEFTWKQKSWKPWDWQLTRVEHPLLHIQAGID